MARIPHSFALLSSSGFRAARRTPPPRFAPPPPSSNDPSNVSLSPKLAKASSADAYTSPRGPSTRESPDENGAACAGTAARARRAVAFPQGAVPTEEPRRARRATSRAKEPTADTAAVWFVTAPDVAILSHGRRPDGSVRAKGNSCFLPGARRRDVTPRGRAPVHPRAMRRRSVATFERGRRDPLSLVTSPCRGLCATRVPAAAGHHRKKYSRAVEEDNLERFLKGNQLTDYIDETPYQTRGVKCHLTFGILPINRGHRPRLRCPRHPLVDSWEETAPDPHCVQRMSRGKLAVGVLVFGVVGAFGATAYPVLFSPPSRARAGKDVPPGDADKAKAGFSRPSMWKASGNAVRGNDRGG